MIIQTGRFGEIDVEPEARIQVKQGLLGFPKQTEFCLVDPQDENFIIWLQSMDQPKIAFPLLEPRFFQKNYCVKLSGVELRDLQLEAIHQAAVFVILTIPENIQLMTANLKAPLVINLQAQCAKQVILQENDYPIKYPIFKEFRSYLGTLPAAAPLPTASVVPSPATASVIPVAQLKSSTAISSLGL